MKLEKITFPSAPILLRGARNEFAVAPTALIVSLNGNQIEATTFELGVRELGSSQWGFLDGSRLTMGEVLKLFPDFPPDFKLPESSMRVVKD
jgi:hypothetical protein